MIGTLVFQTLLNLIALALLAAVAVAGGLLPQLRLSAIHVVALAVLATILALVATRVVRSGRLARQLRALRAGVAVFRPAPSRLGTHVCPRERRRGDGCASDGQHHNATTARIPARVNTMLQRCAIFSGAR